MAANNNKVREELSRQFLDTLNKGALPWTYCWKQLRPMNGTTGKQYRGVNALMLSWVAASRGYTDPRWCTYKQAQDKGWQVVKGAKAANANVEYWAYYDREKKKLLNWKDAQAVIKQDPDYAQKNLLLTCRTHAVFNAEQIDGIPAMELGKTDIGTLRRQRDTLISNMGIGYREVGSEAYYSPGNDTVTLPPEAAFDDTYSYMATFFHECGHATGHPTRLNRDLSGGFGSESYAREELRAEIASAFTAQELGLRLTEEQLQSQTNRHAAYIQHWAECLKKSPDELYRAIKDAEKISDYIIENGGFGRQQESALEIPEGLNAEQLAQIQAGRESGLAANIVKLYAKPEYTAAQMNALRYALSDGLSNEQLQVILDPAYTPVQMDIIRACFRAGMTLEQIEGIANPELTPDEMLDAYQKIQHNNGRAYPTEEEPALGSESEDQADQHERSMCPEL